MAFPEGIARTVEWYLAHRDWIDAVADGRYREYYDRLYGGR
jgi:dTDP-glucose 4,6-dehydratase